MEIGAWIVFTESGKQHYTKYYRCQKTIIDVNLMSKNHLRKVNFIFKNKNLGFGREIIFPHFWQ